MEFRILGALEVRDGDRPVSLRGQKQRAVLAVLLLQANEPVPTERLIEAVWGGGPPPTAKTALQGYVSGLRKALGRDRIRTQDPGYRLEVGAEEIDARRFERVVQEGRGARAAGDPVQAAATLSRALALWRGPALADFTYEPFAQAAIARLEELRVAALEDRIDADLALGKAADLVGELEELVAAQPFRERPRSLLMLALYRAGRQADALAVYQDTRRLLVEELGIEPGPELQRLEGAILRQEPELDAPIDEQPTVPVPVQPVREVRKMVTVAVLGLSDATGRRLDPEARLLLRERVTERISQTAARYGGAVAGRAGEGTVVVFGLPTVHEDDALRALLTAHALERELPALNEELEGRFGVTVALTTGVDTGEVVAAGPAEESLEVLAELVDRAAALAGRAEAGEVVLGEATRRLVRDGARLEELRGPEAAGWRLLELIPGGQAVVRRLDAPLVGRSVELAWLRDGFGRAALERTAHLLSVFGVAGIGKSRLARELATLVAGEATVLTGRCLPYGEGITFWPLRELVQEAAGEVTRESVQGLLAGEPDAPLVGDRLAAALGLPGAAGASEDEILWAVRRLAESLASERPLVLVLEDLHWGEPTFLDVVEHLGDTRGAPLLLVCLARPELLDTRPQWGGGRVNAASMLLEPLLPNESEELIENLLEGAPLTEATRARIAEAAEGNPLFLEQLFALLAETADPAAEPVIPPTIEALLAARLDHLGPGEQIVVERGAVVGREFDPDALAELLPEEARSFVAGHLDTLVRKELVRPQPAGRAESFRFGHVLIQQAAYRRIPKALRAELHERFAAWAVKTTGERIAEVEEIAGYHLEQAFRYRKDLGAVDDRTRALAAEAAERLGAAGLRASRRGDPPGAVGLLSRAVDLLPPRDVARIGLLTALARALRESGDLERAESVLAEAVAGGESTGDRRVVVLSELERELVRMHRDPAHDADRAADAATRAIPLFEELGDDAGLALAWDLAAHARFNRGEARRAEEAWASAHAHARRAGDRGKEAGILVYLAFCAMVGPTPVATALDRLEELRREAEGNPHVEAIVLITGGQLEAMRGQFDVARERIVRGRTMLEESGQRLSATMAPAHQLGQVELLAGDPTAAEAAFRAGYEGLERMGETAFLSTLVADLAEAVYAQGRDDEAERLTVRSEQTAAPDDVVSQVGWRYVRAKVLARRGEVDDGERLAREAVTRARRTDYLSLQGVALTALAEVLARAGRTEEAIALAEEAKRVLGLKGDVVSVEQVGALVAGLRERSRR